MNGVDNRAPFWLLHSVRSDPLLSVYIYALYLHICCIDIKMKAQFRLNVNLSRKSKFYAPKDVKAQRHHDVARLK